ncbi:hypothetical protein DM860_006283 [Cuscuta australis]|uniref:C2H2-type domain-containing protein n=1 Tax=Cuscuta australis TaxID=267555 RepID=A0A328DP78_9ASTE|nr:hypothetical protein DM860_006283 [Cuscuta australis]
MMVELKRNRSWREGKAAAAAELESVESMAMANCMSILSRLDDNRIPLMAGDKEFECKTCRKRFHSFQALGGHRASHKKPRIYGDGAEDGRSKKLHLCSVCGMEFDKGQSLGGHMSKHRAKQPPPRHQFLLVPAAAHNDDDVNNRSGDGGGSALTTKEQGEAESTSASAPAAGWDLNLTPMQNERLVTGSAAP